MIACLRPLSALCLAGLLAACASSPSSSLGELPRTPDASIEQLLQQASTAKPEQAASLRLSAADLAYKQQDIGRSARILEQIPLDSLKPAQQVFASTLSAELAMTRNQPKSALKALAHPSLERLAELPVDQQVRTQLVRSRALEADGQTLAAARERVFIAPLLNGDSAASNHEAIWTLVSHLPLDQLQGGADKDLSGWLELARLTKTSATLEQQQASIDNWRKQNPDHPAAPTSQWGLGSKSKLGFSPQVRRTGLSSEPVPSGVEAWGRFGIARSFSSTSRSTAPSCSSRLLISADSSFSSSRRAAKAVLSPPLASLLISSLAALRRACKLSVLPISSRRRKKRGPASSSSWPVSAERRVSPARASSK